MADIIDFNSNETMTSTPISEEPNLAQTVINELQQEVSTTKDLLVFSKTYDDEFVLFHTGLSLQERSLIIQLIQNDIQHELSFPEVTELENQ